MAGDQGAEGKLFQMQTPHQLRSLETQFVCIVSVGVCRFGFEKETLRAPIVASIFNSKHFYFILLMRLKTIWGEI